MCCGLPGFILSAIPFPAVCGAGFGEDYLLLLKVTFTVLGNSTGS